MKDNGFLEDYLSSKDIDFIHIPSEYYDFSILIKEIIKSSLFEDINTSFPPEMDVNPVCSISSVANFLKYVQLNGLLKDLISITYMLRYGAWLKSEYRDLSKKLKDLISSSVPLVDCNNMYVDVDLLINSPETLKLLDAVKENYYFMTNCLYHEKLRWIDLEAMQEKAINKLSIISHDKKLQIVKKLFSQFNSLILKIKAVQRAEDKCLYDILWQGINQHEKVMKKMKMNQYLEERRIKREAKYQRRQPKRERRKARLDARAEVVDCMKDIISKVEQVK